MAESEYSEGMSRTVHGPARGSNQSGMRAHNERLVLSMIRRQGPMPKAEIARATGLSAQTISVIMRSLENEGLLERGEPIRGKVGQPSIPMGLAKNGAFFLGLKVGRRSVDLILINFVGDVLGRVHRPHPYPTPDEIQNFTLSAVAELKRRLPKGCEGRIAGLGIAIPFSLWDWGETIGAPSGEMDQWRVRDIQAELSEKLPFPVYLQNDASAACASELVFGTSDLPASFLHFYIGYFIGGGVVLNNRLFTGATGNAGAMGPLPIPGGPNGTRPLLEIASLCVLEDKLKQAGQPSSVIWEGPEAWSVDPETEAEWIRTTAYGLAFATASACAILDHEAVLVDGWLPKRVRRDLVVETREALKGFNLTGVETPEVLEGTIGPDARSLGAAALPLSERYLVDLSAVLLAD